MTSEFIQRPEDDVSLSKWLEKYMSVINCKLKGFSPVVEQRAPLLIDSAFSSKYIKVVVFHK